LVFAALIFYSIGQINNWIIPFTGILTVVLIVVCYYILIENSFGDINRYVDGLSFDFSNYNKLSLIISITIILSSGLWALFFYISKLQDKTRAYRPSFILILIALIIGSTIVILAPNKNGSEFIFLFGPLAIIMANYIESIKETWFAEVFVWLLIITPIAQLVF
jgi:predicted MFS family arabinose efflux permease